MKAKSLFFIFILFILFSIKSGFCQKVNYSLIISQKIKKKKKLKKEIYSLKKLENKILDLYIKLHIQSIFLKKELVSNKNLNISQIENTEIIKNILLKKFKKLKLKEKILKKRYKSLSKEIKKLKIIQAKSLKTKSIKNSFNYWPENMQIKPGSYIIKIKKTTLIKSPISGIVKAIGYKENNMLLILANKNYIIQLKNLDDVKVNIGDFVKKNEIIGSINKNKKMEVYIFRKDGL